ncbi:MAG TPA: glycosyl hydrolase family 8 [Polyangia bacterium]|nr:glycosyl hydrolase family 8 [Polyangia bacterium]
MIRRRLLALACLPSLSLLACASPSGSGGGGKGGSSATGGSTGSGGSSATGGATGSGGAGAGVGTAVGHPFPLGDKSASWAGNCMLTTVANASTQTQSAYSNWKSAYLVSGSPGQRVQRPENGNDTVSEGIGYGMLAAVYMNDQTTFDLLLQYQQAHLDSKGLMNWHITSSGATASDGSYSASDGDEDIAFAMLMASDQWAATATYDYLAMGRTMIEAIKTYSLFSDGTLQNGDNFNTSDTLNIDYFSPAYYRLFQKAIPDGGIFQFTVSQGYKHLAAQSGTDGLVPDSSNLEDSTTCSTCKATYGYDACRTPWRIAMDWCWNAEPNAQTYLMKIGAFFNGVGASNIGDGYSLTGTKTSSNQNLAFSGPAGVGAMQGFQSLVDGSFNLMVSPPGGNSAYFPQSLRVLSMLMMSGNMVDYSKF